MKESVAIIGYHGRFPGSENSGEFWETLQAGPRPLVSFSDRGWPVEQLSSAFNMERDSWAGGLLSQTDAFDAELLNLPAAEAERLDPEQYALLESIGCALEHAGYADQKRNGRTCIGLFAGSMWQDFSLTQYERGFARQKYRGMGSSLWNLANSASYFFNFTGPSVGVDTACSSALTCMHLACQSLVTGECDLAAAAAVNLALHPFHYIYLAKEKHLAGAGEKQCFNPGREGYLPAEGAATILLKRLEDARRDGDFIHAVIRATGINHSGRGLFYKAPQIDRQAALAARVLGWAGVEPEQVSHMELTAYGSEVFDTAELVSLVKAYRSLTSQKQFCGLGSLKPVLGHMEAASGLAQILKVILQIRHRMRLPIAHPPKFAAEFALHETPFFLPEAATPWTTSALRVAGIHCVGGGGSNGHLILEEYKAANVCPEPMPASWVPMVFSARTPERLQAYLQIWKNFLATNHGFSLRDMAFTLLEGREPMVSRQAFLVFSLDGLRVLIEQAILSAAAGTCLAEKGVEQAGVSTSALREALHAWCKGGTLAWEDWFSRGQRVPLPESPRFRCRFPKPAGAAPLEPAGNMLESLFAEALGLPEKNFTSATVLRQAPLGFHAVKKIHDRLETYYGPLPGNFIFRFDTLGDLKEYLQQQKNNPVTG